jgi:methanogen homoaconitase large subunit
MGKPTMGQTLAEQILSHAAGRKVNAGELIIVRPDVVMSHDSLTPSIIKIMQEELGVARVHDPDQLVMVFDHVVPAATVDTANSQNQARRFAREQGIRLFDVGYGICHQVLVEERIAAPGKIVLGADSHSTTYGAVGAFGSGMGSTDVALIWATGRTWLRVPETIRVQINGRLKPGVEVKDLALKLCQMLTIAGANYASVEYHGLDWLPVGGRQTLASMAVEMGAKVGIVPPTGEAVAGQLTAPEWLFVDPTAHYARSVEIDLETLQPQVALPHAVDTGVDISEVAGIPVTQVFLGTCTNGRYEDMRSAADLLRGRQVAAGVRMVVTPASSREFRRAADDGTLTTLVEAGAVITTPGCGACMGRHQGTLGDEDVCLSTANRNFKGRMGSPKAKIYLGSALTAAATAIKGQITDPRSLM